MATANTKTTTEMPELAQRVREQLVSTVAQGQRMSVDAARTWVKAVSVLPLPDPFKTADVPAIPSVEATTTYTFDVAAELLDAQRAFASQLTNVLVTEKTR